MDKSCNYEIYRKREKKTYEKGKRQEGQVTA
jgi:hypothetical protein